jgi:hypothetical protein
MRKLVALLVVGLMASPALAQPYDARGGFNGWGQTPMVDDLDGSYSVTIGGLTAGDRHNFKVAVGDWVSQWPGSDSRTVVNGAGDITLHFFPGAIADGWNPGGDRVGYSDHGQHGWEIMGAFNGWTDGVDTAARQMTDQGGGLYSVDYTIAAPGSYDYKFRESNSWDIAIGDDFGNSAANNNITTVDPNSVVRFELDLPNGRWRTTIVPEPATLALLGMGAVAIIRRRR